MTPAELLRKADAALASARRDFDAGDLDGGQQALLCNVSRCPSGIAEYWRACPEKVCTVIAQFGRHFCKDGPLPTELGRVINEAQELRVEGDYGAGAPDATEVRAYVAKAAEFVAAVKGIVSGTPSASSP